MCRTGETIKSAGNHNDILSNAAHCQAAMPLRGSLNHFSATPDGAVEAGRGLPQIIELPLGGRWCAGGVRLLLMILTFAAVCILLIVYYQETENRQAVLT